MFHARLTGSKTPPVITLCDKLKKRSRSADMGRHGQIGFAGAGKRKSLVSPRKGSGNRRMLCPSSALSTDFVFSSTSPRGLFKLGCMEKASPS